MNLQVDDEHLDSAKFKEVLRAQVELLNKEAGNINEIRQYVVSSLFLERILFSINLLGS